MTPLSSQVTVLVNSSAGATSSPEFANDITAAFAVHGIRPQIVSFEPADDVVALARQAAQTSAVVVAAGGDGTVNVVASVVADTEVILGVLPVGTLNHFAKDVGLPLSLEEAVATIAAGRVSRVDAAAVNDRVFVNNSSIGVYPNAVKIREQLRKAGHRKWIAMAIASWRVLRTYRGVRVTLRANGAARTVRTPFVFIGNNEYALEGLEVGSREHLTSGQLFVYLAPQVHTRDLPMMALRTILRRPAAVTAFEVICTSELTIDTSSSRRTIVSLDGETTALTFPLRYESRPGALRVMA